MIRSLCCVVCCGLLLVAAAPADAQTAKPELKPSPSPAAVGNSQTSKLPAGTDTGVPGSGQNPSLTDSPTGENTRSSVLRRRAAEQSASGADVGIDDDAAAKAAARRPAARAAARAGSGPGPGATPGPLPKPSPPSR